MVKPACSEEEFVQLYNLLGPTGLSNKLGISIRAIQMRKNTLVAKGHELTPPFTAGGKLNPVAFGGLHSHPGRIDLNIINGTVLVGSDAHYWPDIVSTAHRGFVAFARALKPKFVVMNGDMFDGASISRHPPLPNWEKAPSVIEEIEACQERLQEIRKASKGAGLVWTLGNHDCLDDATECLTKRGWVNHGDIRADDEVLSLVDDKAAWSPINEVVRFDYCGPLVRIEKTRMSMAVTPNHRVLLDRLDTRVAKYNVREYRCADDLPWSFNMPLAALSDRPGAPLTDDQIRLAGWLLTDGCYGRDDISIFQSKPERIEEIRALLERLGLEHSFYTRHREVAAVCGRTLVKPALPQCQFRLTAPAQRRVREWLPGKTRLPAWAGDLDGRQFGVFLEAVIAGDGVWDGHHPEARTCCVVYGRAPILDDLQAVALAHGWRARIATDTRGALRLCMALEPKIRIERPEVFTEQYAGTVWCLRVPHSNFMVRRRGCAYFTGNSRFTQRLATVAPEFAKVHGIHLKDHFPEWKPAFAAWVNSNVVIKHRYKGGIHAAHNNTVNAGLTVVTGHLHSLKVTPFRDYNGTRWGVDTGTLADPYGPQFHYSELNPLNHESGFVVLTFKEGRLLQPELARVCGDGLIDFRGEVVSV